MRLLLAPLAALLLAATSSAQITTHVRIDDLENGFLKAAEFEQMGFDVVEGGAQPTSLELVVSDATMEYLEQNGYAVEVIAVGRPYHLIQAEALAASTEAVPAGYHPLGDINNYMNFLAASFPALARRVNVTQAYGAPQTFEGRDIFALKISDNVNADEDEPSFLLVSNHHAREIMTPVVATETMTKLLNDYASDPDIKALVDGYEIWIAPTWNPDGLEYVWNVNSNWRRNRAVNGGCTGVDTNRNYQAGWGSSCGGSTGCNDTYRGPSANSEAETQTMLAFTAAERFAKVMDFHSAGKETLWELSGPPNGSVCATHPWASFMQANAGRFSQAAYGNSANRHPSAQGEQFEWQTKQGAYAYLMEIGNTFQPSYATALAEAALVFGSIQTMLEDEIKLTGHTTDSCSGAAVETTITFIGLSLPYNMGFSSGGPFGRFDIIPPDGSYNVRFSATGYANQTIPVSIVAGTPTVLNVEMVATGSGIVNYCTPGTSASGCQSLVSASGAPSASAASGFVVSAATAEGAKSGQFYYGVSGQQANPWGNSTSFRCVAPPTWRAGVLPATGTVGACDANFAQDLTVRWQSQTNTNPGAGATVQLQFWYRDPQNTSNRTTSFSDAIEFGVCP
jgi:hypothetical protein